MNHVHILGFPNHLPRTNWKTYFPKFRDEQGDDVALHFLKFQMHIHRLRIEFPKDCLMKMFMASLEGKARSWFEKLSLGSFYSLKYFHSIFFERYSFISLFIIG